MNITYDSLPDVIWGEMYGREKTDPDAIIIDIKKKSLDRTEDDTGVFYVWGWPGPDINLYRYSDYGITWAYTAEEMRPAITWDEYEAKKNKQKV